MILELRTIFNLGRTNAHIEATKKKKQKTTEVLEIICQTNNVFFNE